jgi:hypothetical protein
MTECVSNEAKESGGGIYNSGSNLFINRSKFLENKSREAGGIFSINGTFRACNSLFTGNSAALQGSVAIVKNTRTASLSNCTIVENGYCPIVSQDYVSLNLYNNIIVSNTEKNKVSAWDVMSVNQSYIEAKYNICALEGTGNIFSSLNIFRNPSEGDFRIRYDLQKSYLGPMDIGNNDYVIGSKDLYGNIRIVDNSGDGRAMVDMGAYEQDMLKVAFSAAHPQAGVVHGSLSGETEQWVLKGNSFDPSLVTVVPDDGWEFNYWETLDHTKVLNFSQVNASLKLYAKYKEKYVAVAYQFDPDKLKLPNEVLTDISNPNIFNGRRPYSGSVLLYLPEMQQLITKVKQYHTPQKLEMEGVRGWTFGYWDPWPDSVAEDTIMVAVARPTVTYDFGNEGYYADGSNKKVVISDFTSPLFVPTSLKIKTDDKHIFLGWSNEKEGSLIELPNKISEPTTYYAVYRNKNIKLSVEPEGDVVIKKGDILQRACLIDDPGEDNLTATVNYGDGTRKTIQVGSNRSFKLEYRYQLAGDYNIKIQVKGSDDCKGTLELNVKVKNTIPILILGQDEDINEGSMFERTCAFVDPDPGIWRITADYNNKLGPENIPWEKDGLNEQEKVFQIKMKCFGWKDKHTIDVVVEDEDGGTDTGRIVMNVMNVAPLVFAGLDEVINRGILFTRTISFKDPGPDEWGIEVDYGDGNTQQNVKSNNDKTLNLKHVYMETGSYIVTVCVNDGDGGIGEDSFQIRVKDYILKYEAGDDVTVTEGKSCIREIPIIGPVEKIKGIEVDYGDGTNIQQYNATRNLLLNHSFPDDGKYKVNIKITDVDGDEYKDSFNVTVENFIPVVNAESRTDAGVNQTCNFSGAFIDPGQDSWSAEVNYGDSSLWQKLSLSGKNFTLSHSYCTPGDYTVTVRVTDDDNGVGEGTCRVYVRSSGSSLSDEARLSSMAVDAGGILTTVFDPDTTNYLINPNAGTMNITASAMEPNATIAVSIAGGPPVNYGNTAVINVDGDFYGNAVIITVTAENGISTALYTVNIAAGV